MLKNIRRCNVGKTTARRGQALPPAKTAELPTFYSAMARGRVHTYLFSMQLESLSQLFPDLCEAERAVAAEALDRYLEIAWEILEELEAKKRAD